MCYENECAFSEAGFLQSSPPPIIALSLTLRIMPGTWLMTNDICCIKNTKYDDNSARRLLFLIYNLLFICHKTFKTCYVNEIIAISLRGGIFTRQSSDRL